MSRRFVLVTARLLAVVLALGLGSMACRSDAPRSESADGAAPAATPGGFALPDIDELEAEGLTPEEMLRRYMPPVIADAFNPDVTDETRDTRTPQRGGILRIRSSRGPTSLNPLTSTWMEEREIEQLLFDSMIEQDPVSQEYYGKMAWGFAKADRIKLPGENPVEGTLLEMGDESDPESMVVFVPDARRYTFNRHEIAEIGENSVTLTAERGGATYTGELTEREFTVEINEAHDPARAESIVRVKMSDLDTWRDTQADGAVERPFRKRESAFTFFIRPGITWHDGRPFTGRDVLFSFEMLMNVNVRAMALRSYYLHVTEVDVRDDDLTVHFVNEKPAFNQFGFCGAIPTVPRHVFEPEKYGGDEVALGEAFNDSLYKENPIGTGPYKMGQWRRDELVTVTRHDDYWASKLPAGAVPNWSPEQPYMDEIRFVIQMENSVALRMLQRGDLDADMGVEPEIWFLDEALSETFTDRFVRATRFGFLYTYIGFNLTRPIFQDPAVREAITLLIPREQIARDIHRGLAEPVTGPTFSRGPGYDATVPQAPHDPERARRVLGRAGWIDRDGDGVIEKEIDGRMVPLEFEYMIHTAKEYHSKVADIIKESVEQAGIRMTIRRLDIQLFGEQTREKSFDAVRLAWAANLDPDLYQIWHSSQAENRGSNYVSYANPRVDELVETIREEFDPATRWRMAREVHRIVAEDRPMVFLFGFEECFFINRGIHGVRTYPSMFAVNWTEWWWADEQRRAAR